MGRIGPTLGSKYPFPQILNLWCHFFMICKWRLFLFCFLYLLFTIYLLFVFFYFLLFYTYFPRRVLFIKQTQISKYIKIKNVFANIFLDGKWTRQEGRQTSVACFDRSRKNLPCSTGPGYFKRYGELGLFASVRICCLQRANCRCR